MRLRRALTVVALLAVAATGLSACESGVGRAATVNGHRLSEGDLASYVKAGSTSYTDQGSGATVIPKLNAIETWVISELLVGAIENTGGPITPDERSGARSVVYATQSPDAARQHFGALGYTDSFATLSLDQTIDLVVLIERLVPNAGAAQALSVLRGGQAGPALIGAIRRSSPTVAVSPRYGTWNPTQLALSQDPGSGLPPFVRYGARTAG